MIANLPTPAERSGQSERRLHVLTLTPFYPVLDDDAQGCFVAEPLAWMDRVGVSNTVLAVQPFYRGRVRPGNSLVPAEWSHFFTLPGNFGLSTSGAFLFAKLLTRVRRLHHSHRVDMIHAHSALPCGHAAALLSRELGIPFVVTVHGLDAFSTNQVGGYAGRGCDRVSRLVYRSARQVICISEKVCERVMEAGGSTNATVVYNGVDTQLFSPGNSEIPEDVILSLGNLIPIKGHELLLRAVAAVHGRYPQISCEIIGDGEELGRLGSLVTELGIARRVRFLGRQNRSQVVAAMRRCTLFALPSRYEGLGCVYLEAMSTGKAAIGCRGQGIEEVIEHGANGWLVDPNDVRGLTDAISTLLENASLRRQIGEAARRTILRGFTLEHQATQLARLYRECAT